MAIEDIEDYPAGTRRLLALGSSYSLPQAAEPQQTLILPAAAAAAMAGATSIGRTLREASNQCSQAVQISGIRIRLRVACTSAGAAPAIQSLAQALQAGTPSWLVAEYPAACVPLEGVVVVVLASSSPIPAPSTPPLPPAVPPKSILAAKLAAKLEQWRAAWAGRLANGPSRWAARLQRRLGHNGTLPGT